MIPGLPRHLPVGLLLAACAACSGAPPSNGPDYMTTDTPPPRDDPSAQPPAGSNATAGSTANPAATPEEGPSRSPAAPWCTTHPATFCADFDAAPLPAGFSKLTGNLLSIVGQDDRSLVLKAPPMLTGGAYESRLSQPFATTSSDMTLAFDLSPVKLNTKTGELLVAAIDFTGNAKGYYSIRIVYTNGRARVEETLGGVVPDIYHPYFDLPMNKWSRIKLDVVLGGASKSVKLSVDGAQVGVVETLKPPAAIDLHPTLLLGAVYVATPHDGWELSYDNVTMDLR